MDQIDGIFEMEYSIFVLMKWIQFVSYARVISGSFCFCQYTNVLVN